MCFHKSYLWIFRRVQAELTDAPDDSYWVVGVNHKLTGQSLYSSVTAYDYPRLASAGLVDSRGQASYTAMDSVLVGSAKSLLPSSSVADLLYAVQFSRNCSAAIARGGPKERVCFDIAARPTKSIALALPTTSPVVFIERMYIHPGTKSGPMVQETILPYLVHSRRH